MLTDIVFILAGLLLLVKGGDYLVDGSASIAKRLGLSNMIIGLTVIGFGTSAPELLVSAKAAWVGSSGIAIGNVVGSNIANIALILGVTAMIFPIPATRTTLRRDAPFMLMAIALFLAAGFYGVITRPVGLVFFLLLVSFVSWQVINCRRNNQQEAEEDAPQMALWKALLMVIGSIVALVAGADTLIKGATGVALALGTSERVIGLTIVAIGTSLPELSATVMAARKHQTDMALGNIIGSVTFNILCVVGLSALITPIHNTAEGFVTDYIVMGLLSLFLMLFLRTKHLLERWEGLALLTVYAAYIIWTII